MLVELTAKHGIHSTMIAAWNRQAAEGMQARSRGASDAARAASEAEVEKLHTKIDQLVMERDLLARVSGR